MVPVETLSACNGPAACPFAQAQRVREEQSILREENFVPSPLVVPHERSRWSGRAGSGRAKAARSGIESETILHKAQLCGDSSVITRATSRTRTSRDTLERQNDAVGAAALLEGTGVEPWVQQRARVRGKFPLPLSLPPRFPRPRAPFVYSPSILAAFFTSKSAPPMWPQVNRSEGICRLGIWFH